jgi:acid phosphatase family membrane protein YuiD
MVAMYSLSQALQNITIWSAFVAWVLAQTIKFVWKYRKTKEIDFGCFVSTGGMPSAHSAMASALALSVGLRAGFGSTVFAVTLAFAIVVMFDAQSVRRAAGYQARLLNQIVQELFKEHHLSQQKLAELLGHTRTEVFIGMGLGVLTALAIHHLFR